ncbi:polar amino acid transport system permease protein [Paenalcaligenes hominis]|uniref:Amino acid ABC transporter n=1 Tax=Paenalcaligenes hominis TaxID=643674 RepID=A0A1U9K0U7_9BURK|nr:amino acid ABC transporter permease [Paenalcaligenes hominis]AQS51665.1 amino acid ABC transporter [Paenalcaligenes hominis]NJB65192.1 polar amino acid transport system permease protein [Paenalcaligenes hominis]GGE55906.1 amino acid ABC transporter [Paenalcaligenes hominis]
MFDFHVALESIPLLLSAAKMTLFVSAVGLVVGFVIAVIVAAASMSPSLLLRRITSWYVFVFRGIPLLVQLMVVFYFFPVIGINVPPLVAAVVAISLCEGAYIGEILRGGFMGIPKGQLEATQLLGMSRVTTVVRIQVPQALRLTMPALINEMIMLVKASSLISIVGVTELTRMAQNIAASTFSPMEAYLGAAFVYFLINGVLSVIGYWAERHYGRTA